MITHLSIGAAASCWRSTTDDEHRAALVVVLQCVQVSSCARVDTADVHCARMDTAALHCARVDTAPV